MAIAAASPFLRIAGSHSTSQTIAAYAILLRIIAANAPQSAAAAVRRAVGFSVSSHSSATVSAKQPENSTSFVALTAIIIWSGYSAKNTAARLPARAPH